MINKSLETNLGDSEESKDPWGNLSPFDPPSVEDTNMDGEEPRPSPSPDHPRDVERGGEAQPSPGSATPGKFTREQKDPSQPNQQAGSDHLQNMGTINLGFVEEPPPYAPPDPKDIHLYPPFQADLPPRSYIFYQPTAPRQALSQPPNTRAALKRADLIQAAVASRKARTLVLFSLFFGVFVSIGWIVYVVVTLYL
ncbi:hypothetical protein Chor_002106 [Crotalus horridus]